MEIVDYRPEQRDRFIGDVRNVVDIISDNAASAGIVMGTEKMLAHADLTWFGKRHRGSHDTPWLKSATLTDAGF